jgi:hypothetical protein
MPFDATNRQSLQVMYEKTIGITTFLQGVCVLVTICGLSHDTQKPFNILTI